jgi:hypothetical protein
MSVIYNYAGPLTITGEKSNFGDFLLNPSTQGSSFLASGNVIFFKS